MKEYSEQDLRYAAELREEVHLEALEIIHRTRPDIAEVVDPHAVEDYFQESWEYPGRWYTVVAIPYGFKGRKAFVEALVRNTLAESGKAKTKTPDGSDDPFYALIAEYPDCVIDNRIEKNDSAYSGMESHKTALKAACRVLFAPDDEGAAWHGDPELAKGEPISIRELFSSDHQKGKLNCRRAFLRPPHGNGYTEKDLARINAALFHNGTDELEAYDWTTDWSDYFDDGHEWWGALCVTVYDKSLDRFVVMMASATD